ncbi:MULTISPECIES: aspartate/glutamate racemase family protein [unclassified Marinobacterium]|jgi:aspartate racemase|uniref:aspartate/glutamate racemase family protein n=1 Tax=unclassified Marinobacterium TaxID=2644139 RepID=UPI001569FB9E|nr:MULTISPECIES: aspartate/glutamate racemase family protein [unclassified Marinobacterium]NRP14374.1 Aspartate racemase [Marinobacterium sp. xm-a-152]NRP27494.1 Aspartate racemase [Marinobacterium sp. xm-d-420]NRP36144.1 Aspartate racemase [Marinobacterium sp. xm-d-579]NRP47208.1 Aspartate racemase [Marinobacterium sp. xm-d-543]NRP57752.1 Aspartate racemase [Marinobacterium sp. xm-d-510]
MNTIGLLGGMSWESTLSYYKAINEGVKKRLGGLHSAQIALYSVDFDPIEKLQHEGNWDGTAEILTEAAQRVEAAGADFLLICTNTMHKVAPQIESGINIPLIHIADATAETLVSRGIQKVGLLGTAFTMEQDFYKGRLTDKYGLDVIVPDANDRSFIHRVIYEELCLGTVTAEAKDGYLLVIDRLAAEGAEAVILGCTEIGLLVKQEDTEVDLFDTTEIHAQAAVNACLR